MVVEIAALDLWNLFTNYVFGSFFMAMIGIALMLFIIGGVLGRISIYTITWYCLMFIMAMTIGYGYLAINIIITTILLLAASYSAKSYFTKE